MSNILIIGYTTEGNTDERFLGSIIRRTFEDIALECESLIDIHSVQYIKTTKESYAQEIVAASKNAFEIGVMVLCIHADADSYDDLHTFANRINPAIAAINAIDDSICKIIVPLVPIHMTEAWLLADVNLLKNEIGTNKNLNELGLNIDPEQVADPKTIIENAINIAFEDRTARQRKRSVTINELFLPIGQKIQLNSLEALASYLKFKNAVRDAYRALNYLQ